MLIEALQSLDNNVVRDPWAGLGLSVTTPGSASSGNTNVADLPFFFRQAQWPPLPWMPRPEQIPYPPRYVSDLLVRLYFDQIHYTFPIVCKPHFLRVYAEMGGGGGSRADSRADAGFLSVFFAICACASGLLPRSGADSRFPGLDYYQKALVLHYSLTGQASLEAVQCLGLLAMCTAGWNTLTQSWKFAGQAVRAAQDIGLHVGLAYNAQDQSSFVADQLARRIWWSICGLEQLVSIMLGRPMAVDNDTCLRELPFEMDDEQLLAAETTENVYSPGTSQLTGFIVFSELCRIAGQVVRSSRTLQRQRRAKNPRKVREAYKMIRRLDRELQSWLHRLPDSIKFSANHSSSDHKVHLTMCVVTFILHAASIINLQTPGLPLRDRSDLTAKAPAGVSPQQASQTGVQIPDNEASPTAQCIKAARSCVQTGELVLSRVPPSHYLAFCVYQLAVAGVVL